MTSETILLVDDDPLILALMSEILNTDYRVRAATSGERALELAATEPLPDLILLDVELPGMNGYGVLTQLKESVVTRDIPVIFVTARESDADEELGLSMGAVDYITKPIRPAIMQARVKNHLRLKQVRDFLEDKAGFLEAEVARRMEENLLIQDVSIRALAAIAETRDTDTGNHILRTQSYVRTLAEHLRDHPRFRNVISDRYIELVTKSAPLHDIGKVGIPDRILQKPGKLTPPEWEVMKTHPMLGATAIERAEEEVNKPVEFLSLTKEIARWHHEYWDGSGYPDGLAGDQIPVSARLMALADVFDALTTRRVYKEPFPFEKAREMIVAQSGTHFDQDVTDAFIACFDKFVSIAETYKEGNHNH